MSPIEEISLSPKPFLRWAGGKTWLIKHLKGIVRRGYKSYHEPFLGGGAVYFHMGNGRRAFLSDLNSELILTYTAVRDNVADVIGYLEDFRNSKSFYYQLRPKKFRSIARRAAQFIYLNQTSFNGIYRVNLEGIYNVPYGFRKKKFLDEDGLRVASMGLGKAILKCHDFEQSLSNVRAKDLVFIDPPYTVTHNNNGFIKYNQKLFSIQDQHRLAQFVDAIKRKGAYYLLTNAAHGTIRDIFDKSDTTIELVRSSVVGGSISSRTTTTELIFTNAHE